MPTPPAFPICAWAQPVAHFAKLKSIGINTLLGYDNGGGVSKPEWEDRAAFHGLWFITAPDATRLSAEAAQPFRLGWAQEDEPDNDRLGDKPPADHPTRIPSGRYKGWTKPEVLAARYALCKQANPNLPVFVNFNGERITPKDYTHGEGHKEYLRACDWFCHDWHRLNKNFARYPIDLIRQAMNRLSVWSAEVGGTPRRQFAFVEASDEVLDGDPVGGLGRGPTPDEVEQTTELELAAGASGICYFFHRLQGAHWRAGEFPNGWYSPTPEVEQRIRTINARLDERFNVPTLDKKLELALDRIAALEADRAETRKLLLGVAAQANASDMKSAIAQSEAGKALGLWSQVKALL